MLVKLKKNWKVRNKTIKAGTIIDVHYITATDLIKNGTAEFEILTAETV